MSYINPSYFPFGPVNPVTGAAAINYDLDIYEAYPGLVLIPTEPNGVYVAFREVDGCSWWVLNADWSTADLQWEQNSPQNPALPAYAFEQCSNGTVTRYVAAATNTPGTQVNWVPVWSMDALGNITQSPQTTTAADQVTLSLDPTWNAGTSVIMSCLEMAITDQSSSASSWLENFAVNDTPVWQIRKDGTLETGIIPFARITGYTPPTTLNNATLTGTTTVTGPLDAEDGITVTGAPGTFADGASVANGLTVTGGITADDEDITGNLQVGGTATIHNLDVTGSVTLPAGSIPVENITGSNGIAVTDSAGTYNVSGGTLVQTIESTDGSVTVTATGQTVNLTAGSHVPLVYGASFVVAQNYAVGATTGTLTFPTALPGSGSTSYTIIVSGSLQFQNASRVLTLTGSGSGVTWPNSPQNYENSQAGSFPFTFYGTTTGGNNPVVTWTCNDMLGYTPMTMVMVAYVNP